MWALKKLLCFCRLSAFTLSFSGYHEVRSHCLKEQIKVKNNVFNRFSCEPLKVTDGPACFFPVGRPSLFLSVCASVTRRMMGNKSKACQHSCSSSFTALPGNSEQNFPPVSHRNINSPGDSGGKKFCSSAHSWRQKTQLRTSDEQRHRLLLINSKAAVASGICCSLGLVVRQRSAGMENISISYQTQIEIISEFISDSMPGSHFDFKSTNTMHFFFLLRNFFFFHSVNLFMYTG